MWKNIGPRLGASYDLSGKGKTVLKFNYGSYWLYPAGRLRQQTSTRTRRRGARSSRGATLTPTAAGIPGEQQGNPTSATGGTAATIYDPDIQNTFAHQVMLFVEHEAAPNLGVRTGIRLERTASADRVRPTSTARSSAYTVPVTIRDPGPDGRASTARRRRQR